MLTAKSLGEAGADKPRQARQDRNLEEAEGVGGLAEVGDRNGSQLAKTKRGAVA